jgi:hypothetical protein
VLNPNLTVNNKTLEKYLCPLKGMNNLSKKKLIIKLTETLEAREGGPFYTFWSMGRQQGFR